MNRFFLKINIYNKKSLWYNRKCIKEQWGDFVNQILITGEEQEQIIGKVTKKVEKQKKVLPINGIIVFDF